MSGSPGPAYTCQSCVYLGTNPQNGRLVCTRSPPTLLPLAPGSMGAWPLVAPNDWCGEWAGEWAAEPVSSYSASFSALANASAGDLFMITGSNTMVVRVMTVVVSATAGSNVMAPISLVLRSTRDTGGTPVTAVPSDNLNAPASNAVMSFAAAPTAGTVVGTVGSVMLPISSNVAGNMSAAPPQVFFGANLINQALTLRGSTNCLCLQIPAVTAASWSVTIRWTEGIT